MKLLVSFIRWSTKKQDSGDSLRRQQDLIDSFYANHLDDYYMTPEHRYVDKGKSGFHQKHKAEGAAFRRMFDNVMSKVIPAGSLIIVENFDRISRADIDTAIEDVKKMLRKGVGVMTLGDSELYDKSSLTDPVKLIKHIIIAERAHDESLLKQKRVSEVWERKIKQARETGLPIGKQMSGWLELSDDRKQFFINESKAEIVRKIFEMRLAGHSMFAICKWLNEHDYPTVNDRKVRVSKTLKPNGGNWSAQSIKCLLISRAVIGYLPAKYSPDRKTILREEIPDYYPRIIDDQTFHAVQQLLADSGKGKVSSGEHWLYANILRTLVRCRCGLVMIPSGIRKPVYQGTYRCNGMSEGRCDYGSVSRKLLDTELCTRLFSKLTQLYDSNVDVHKMEDLQRKIDVVDSELTKLTDTLLELPNIIQIRNALAEKQKEKDSLSFALKREKSRVDSVVDMDLSKLDLETTSGRTEAHLIIKKMVSSIIVNGRDKMVDVNLVNGNVIKGFDLSGKTDHALTLAHATNADTAIDDIAIFGQPVVTIYRGGERREVTQPSYNEYPEAEEPDYPNTED